MRVKKNAPPDLRPVGARALKSAMDTLRPYLFESRCLDLYSGQGRFGFSALKEGASSVIFVEHNSRTAQQLKKGGAQFADKISILIMEAESYLRQALEHGEKFDLVFADPPFVLWNENFSNHLQKLVLPVLNQSAIFLVKLPKRMVAFVPIHGLSIWKTTQFGESKLIYLRYA